MTIERNAGEDAVLRCYDDLRRALAEHSSELPPFVRRNALKALAALWQVANGLDAEPEQLYDLGA